jgi:copper(I)-binding protein
MRCKGFLSAVAAVALMTGGMAAVRAADAPPPVQISDAWIRWLPANLPAGGYATLHNAGERPQVLIGVSSPDYSGVSLHHSTSRGDTSLMRPVSQITILPGATVSFATTGYHIMLEHPTTAVQPGDHVSIALHFAGGAAVNVLFEVRKPLAPHTSDMPGMQH